MEKQHLMEKRAISFLVLSVLLLGLVGAYGVSSPYWKGHPLNIAPGDTKTVSITLQNMDEEDITIEVSLKKGSEIASIREGEYLVKTGTKDTEILVTVSIPEDVNLDTLYEVTIASAEVISGDTGGVALGIAMDTTFDVLVADVTKSEPEKTNAWIIYLIIAIVIVIILILTTKKKKKKSRKSK